MDGHLYLALLAIGALTALTPWAIVGLIVMLSSEAGPAAAVAFSLGWLCAVTFVAAAVVAGLGDASEESARTASHGVAWTELVLGILLLALGVRRLRTARSSERAPTGEPAWLAKLDRIRPVVAFAFGTFMINVVFVVDAGLRIASADVDAAEAVVAVLFYAVLATSALAAVLVVYFADRDAGDARLQVMRAWIGSNNDVLTGWLVVAIGALLAARGLVGLA